MKRVIPAAGLMILAKTGHTINLEEPAAFNGAVAEFLAMVEAGRWSVRDPRSDPLGASPGRKRNGFHAVGQGLARVVARGAIQ